MKRAKIYGMKSPVLQLTFARWIGESWFAEFDLHEFDRNEETIYKRVYEIGHLRLRSIGRIYSEGNGPYRNSILVMQDSLFAKFLALFYGKLNTFINWMAPIEGRICGVKEGYPFPKLTLVSILFTIFIKPLFAP